MSNINMANSPQLESKAQNFADTLRDNPKEIIAWCKREIKEYEKLIKIMETGKKE